MNTAPCCKSFVLATVAFCMIAADAFAQNLVDFNFVNNNSNNSTLTSGNTSGLISTASGWSVVSNQISLPSGGVNAVAIASGFGGKNWHSTATPDTSNGHYYGFTLTNTTGSAVTVGSLTIRANAANADNIKYEVQTSISSGGGTGFSDTSTGPTWNFSGTGSAQLHTFDLGSLSVPDGSSIEFTCLDMR